MYGLAHKFEKNRYIKSKSTGSFSSSVLFEKSLVKTRSYLASTNRSCSAGNLYKPERFMLRHNIFFIFATSFEKNKTRVKIALLWRFLPKRHIKIKRIGLRARRQGVVLVTIVSNIHEVPRSLAVVYRTPWFSQYYLFIYFNISYLRVALFYWHFLFPSPLSLAVSY